MRVMFESWFVQSKVDIVFSGHVHSYERSVKALNSFYHNKHLSAFYVCDLPISNYTIQKR